MKRDNELRTKRERSMKHRAVHKGTDFWLQGMDYKIQKSIIFNGCISGVRLG